MQRLRGVRQLGTAYLVYPGAVHTRFEHSLGTAWLCRRLIESIEEFQGPILVGAQRLAVEAAALLHDLTHIPFGHTLEDERRVFPRHDTPERIRRNLPRGELGRALRKLGMLDDVMGLLTGQAEPFACELVSGTICADLLDYLARDAYFCGLSQRYDQRIFRSFRVDASGLYLDAQKSGLIRQDVLSEVVHLLRLRYFLSERVYFHHTKVASGAMICRAVEAAVESGLTLDDLARLTDERLLGLLELRYSGVPVVQRMLEHLASRRLYKRVYVLTRRIGPDRVEQFVDRYHRSAALRREAEEALERRLRLSPGEVIVYCPEPRMQLKEAQVRVKVGESEPRPMADLRMPDIEVLREKHPDLWRFYVFMAPGRMGRAEEVSRACERHFQEPNHLPALQSGQMYLGL
ncbi:MAG: HD domain-containing protein, partial [Candidatus Eremiobacterota bacterium]